MKTTRLTYRMRLIETYKGVEIWQDTAFKYFEAEIGGDYALRSRQSDLMEWIDKKTDKTKQAI